MTLFYYFIIGLLVQNLILGIMWDKSGADFLIKVWFFMSAFLGAAGMWDMMRTL